MEAHVVWGGMVHTTAPQGVPVPQATMVSPAPFLSVMASASMWVNFKCLCGIGRLYVYWFLYNFCKGNISFLLVLITHNCVVLHVMISCVRLFYCGLLIISNFPQTCNCWRPVFQGTCSIQDRGFPLCECKPGWSGRKCDECINSKCDCQIAFLWYSLRFSYIFFEKIISEPNIIVLKWIMQVLLNKKW